MAAVAVRGDIDDVLVVSCRVVPGAVRRVPSLFHNHITARLNSSRRGRGRLRTVRCVSDILAAMSGLPLAPLDAILPPGPALVLAPHPDDETLGCGGLIAEACTLGRDIHVLVMTDGTGSHAGSRAWPAPRLRALREGEIREAVRRLGLGQDRVSFLGLHDTQAPHDGPAFENAVAAVASHAAARGVAAILATWLHDPHADHVATARLAREAASQTGTRLVSYPV